MKLAMHKKNQWTIRTDGLGENVFIFETPNGEPFAQTHIYYDASAGSDNACLQLLIGRVKSIGTKHNDIDHLQEETIEEVKTLLNSALFFDCIDNEILPIQGDCVYEDAMAREIMMKRKFKKQ